MKKAIAIFVSVLFVFALASLSFAVEKKAATAPAAVEKKEAAPVKAEEKKASVVKVKRISGEVVAVDATVGTLTVKSKRQEVSLSTDKKTVVKKGKETKTLADVVAGDKVIVKYKEVDGKNVAKSIAVK